DLFSIPAMVRVLAPRGKRPFLDSRHGKSACPQGQESFSRFRPWEDCLPPRARDLFLIQAMVRLPAPRGKRAFLDSRHSKSACPQGQETFSRFRPWEDCLPPGARDLFSIQAMVR